MSARPTALIADDEPLLREALARQLERAWPDLAVVVQARNGREAIRQCAALRPDICFLDVHMPGLSGSEAAQRIGRSAHLVFVTAYGQYAVQAFAQGALDYLVKPVEPARLRDTVARLKDRLQAAQPAPDLAPLLQQLAARLAGLERGASSSPLRWIPAQVGKTVRLIPVEEVDYLRSDAKHTLIAWRGPAGESAEALVRTPLKELVAQLVATAFAIPSVEVMLGSRQQSNPSPRGALMDSTRNLARRAGLLYVLASSAAPFAYLYVPSVLLVQGDALATADRVRAGEGLLQAAILGELYCATVLVFAALALYRLFQSVDVRTSALMAAMMLVSVPISYVNALSNVAPLLLLKSPAIAAVLDVRQMSAAVTLFLRLHNYGLVVNQVFWGLWLFPIGVLVLRSGFFPRWLAFPLFFAGAGYVLNSLGTLLLPPALRGLTESLQLLGVGETPFFSFYLLIWGVRGHAVDRIAALLVLTSFVIGIGTVGLLLLKRIDTTQYAVLSVAYLVVVLGLVLRWRSEAPAEAGT